MRFALVKKYLLSRLGAGEEGTKPGLTVIETERRQRCEESYGFVHLFWLAAFYDGEIVASIPCGPSETLKLYLKENLNAPEDIGAGRFAPGLEPFAKAEAERLFGESECKMRRSLIFACDKASLRPQRADVRPVRLTDSAASCGEGIFLPEHCMPDGNVYGIVEGGAVVSVAYAHRTGEYERLVADLGVETAKGYRNRGFARACVNAVARHAIESGGEAVYTCSPENAASINTALSAGFMRIGESAAFAVTPRE